MPQPNDDTDFQRILHELDDLLVEGKADLNAPPQYFCPPASLREYFQDEGNRRLSLLCSKLFKTATRPFLPKDILDDHLVAFTTLLKIEEASYIREFFKHEDLSDSRMPFTAKPTHFPVTNNDALWHKFNKTQWIFCPAKIKEETEREWEVDRVLPIIEKTLLRTGGSAQTFRIQIHPDCNGLCTGAGTVSDSKTICRNEFVLKTYHRSVNSEVQYRKEREAFITFRNQLKQQRSRESLIGFYCAYEHNGTFNVILEDAKGGTLEDVFKNEQPPNNCHDVRLFWFQLIEVLRALSMIHDVKTFSYADGGVEHLKGWHQDVKPENILLVTKDDAPAYHGRFKLADLGLSHFHKVNDSEEEVLGKDAQGTRVYGAPETYRSGMFATGMPRMIKPNVDVWSLGCVLSEALVWLLGGWKELENYRNARLRETESLSQNFTGKGAFHNGGYNDNGGTVFEVLDCVKKTHSRIKGRIMREDITTEHVLKLITKHMLDPSVDRPEASLCLDKWDSATRKIYEELKGGSESAKQTSLSRELSTTSRLRPESPHFSKRLSRLSINHHSPRESMAENCPRAHDEDQRCPPEPNANPAPSFPPTDPAVEAQSAPPEPWLMQDAIVWNMATGTKEGQKQLVRECHRDLKDRDHYFLIDDSVTMQEHWSEVISVVQVLTKILLWSKADKKIDIAFTRSPETCRKGNSSDLVKFVRQHVPFEQGGMRGPQSHPDSPMGHILEKYAKLLSSKSFSKKLVYKTGLKEPGYQALSLYFLTDGRYHHLSNLSGPIQGIINVLEREQKKKRYVGIQLVRFGNDPVGKKRLHNLDRGHGLSRDIVDHTPANGDVWKILLGAIIDAYDFVDEDDDAQNGSPQNHPISNSVDSGYTRSNETTLSQPAAPRFSAFL